MAKPPTADIEAVYAIGENAGMTRDDIDDIARPHIQQAFAIGTIRLTNVRSHGELRNIERLISAEAIRRAAQTSASEAHTTTTTATAGQPLATPKQVDDILNLLANHGGGGFFQGPTDRAGITRLTRQQARLYIDSLRDNY